VFALIGRGLKTTEIARTLKVSVKTVETHRLRIREKLALSDSAKLAFTAVRWVHEQCARFGLSLVGNRPHVPPAGGGRR